MPQLNYNLDDIKDYMVEPGRYRARITKIEQTLSKRSKRPMLVWHWKLLTGESKGSELRSWTSLQKNALQNLRDHLTALGYDGNVDLNTDKLVGRKAVLVVGVTTSVDDAGNQREFSSVMNVLPDAKTNLHGVVPSADDDTEVIVDDDELYDDDPDDEDWDDDEEELDDEDWDDEPEPEPEPKRKKKRKKRRLGDDEGLPF